VRQAAAKEARGLIAAARDAGRAALSEPDAKAVLAGFDIAVPRGLTIPRGGKPSTLVGGLAGPFAIKVVSQAIVHKSDVGGVRVGVAASDVDTAIAGMEAGVAAKGLPIDGWLIEEMAPKGVEVVIGGTVDDRFGPCVMVGLGGVLVELLADVAFRICPITRRDAVEMLDELRGVKLLRGWRGTPPTDVDAVIDALLKVGATDGLMLAFSRVIRELDINPLIVGETGAVAADARIILERIAP
jgi:acyl-CoA synthetase (NDP forming)